jgi:D-cysteine desulfhydrase
LISPGASSPLGTLGYVGAGFELADQIMSGECPRPGGIYVPLGTGGTAAGLALGLGLAGVSCPVVAVQVASRITGNRFFLTRLAKRAFGILREWGVREPMPQLALQVVHNQLGPGYASMTPQSRNAVVHAAKLGLNLETTYTGKAFAALLEHRKKPRAGPLMLVNTYGSIEGIKELNQ